MTHRLFLSLLFLLLCPSCDRTATSGTPLRIGILLPLSGEEDLGWKPVLDWAASDINDAGGIDGKRIELVYEDTSIDGISPAANRLLQDDTIAAFIGGQTTTDLMTVASRFVRNQRVLISPSATSEEVFNAWGGKDFIWRTVESDIAQLEAMLALAKSEGALTGALLTSWDDYGATFFNWFGFLAFESGLEILGLERYDATSVDCAPILDDLLAQTPDVLFAVALRTDMISCILRYTRSISPGTRIIFSDGACHRDVLDAIGDNASGMEGLVASENPNSGFSAAFEAHFGYPATPFAAHTYDALLLLSYGLALANGEGGQALVDALKRLADTRETPIDWNPENIARNFSNLAQGQVPNISGASGRLEYDQELYTDPLSSWYQRWIVENGVFMGKEYFFTGDLRNSETSAGNQNASVALRQTFSETPGPEIQREDLWALLVAGSNGWDNYRHQSDVLAQYQLLRKNGVTDERIILIMADDIALNPVNPFPGVVEYTDGGDNNYDNVDIDYYLEDVSAAHLLDILAGNAADVSAPVVDSGPTDNIYLYLSGHGNQDGFFVDSPDPLRCDETSLLTSGAINATLQQMHAESRYRQVFMVVEACHAGALGAALDAPNVLLLTAANPWESSLAANRRENDGVWLSDQFSYTYWRLASDDAGNSLMEYYLRTYALVNGSHVSLYNYENFEGVASETLNSFLSVDPQ